MHIPRPTSAPTHQYQVPLSHLFVETLSREPVPELRAQFRPRRRRDLVRGARRRQKLVRLGEHRPLWIEQRPEHLHQLLAKGPQDRRHRHVAAVGRAHMPAAHQRQRVAKRGLVALVEPAARRNRRARELRLHRGHRPDLGEPFLEKAHA